MMKQGNKLQKNNKSNQKSSKDCLIKSLERLRRVIMNIYERESEF